MNNRTFDSLPKDLQDILLKDAPKVRIETEDNLISTYPGYLIKMQQAYVKVTRLEKGGALWDQWSAKLDQLKKDEGKSYSPELVKLLSK